jgi:hypothetical protein
VRFLGWYQQRGGALEQGQSLLPLAALTQLIVEQFE